MPEQARHGRFAARPGGKFLVPAAARHHDSEMEARVAVLERIAASTERTLERLESKFDRLEEKLDARLDRLDEKFDKLSERRDRDFRILFGALVTVTLGLAGLMAHGFHWLH